MSANIKKLFSDNKENNKRLKQKAKSQGMKTAQQKDALFLRQQDGITEAFDVLNVWEIGSKDTPAAEPAHTPEAWREFADKYGNGDAYAFSKLAEAHDKVLAQRDELRIQHDDCVRRIENVTNQAFAIRKQRNEFLAALSHLSLEVLFGDKAKHFKATPRLMNSCERARAAIASVEGQQ
jgi:hypothetical protein